MRKQFFASAAIAILVLGFGGALLWTPIYFAFIVVLPVVAIGIYDALQTSHSVSRNYPLVGRLRFLLEAIRPEISQYFIESDTDGRPFSRELRSLVYQRAKNVNDTLPFGTRRDLYEPGTRWIAHSIEPCEVLARPPRIRIGGADCKQPYEASLLNVSAMSFGSLSGAAVRALNAGAKKGGFAHNTGEGGLSPHHLEPGGDIVWQIGTGYFGCRGADGSFDPEQFAEKAKLPAVKMIELKLSQGAKPGHGGILPAAKVSAEIAAIRGVPIGEDVMSPPGHRAFDGPTGLLRFIQQLRELSGGKPVGFKLCVGEEREFFSICKAMAETGITPDFVTVDGAEGGTGAAPLEFSNSIGMPLKDGLAVVHHGLLGANVRDKVRVIASGRIITGFEIAEKLALGADLCNSARAMMFALGCIQALRCNTNTCPVGVATQNPNLTKGLHVGDKSERVYRYHQATVESFLELLASAGLTHPQQLTPEHIKTRGEHDEVVGLGDIFPVIDRGAFFSGNVPKRYAKAWERASPDSF